MKIVFRIVSNTNMRGSGFVFGSVIPQRYEGAVAVAFAVQKFTNMRVLRRLRFKIEKSFVYGFGSGKKGNKAASVTRGAAQE